MALVSPRQSSPLISVNAGDNNEDVKPSHHGGVAFIGGQCCSGYGLREPGKQDTRLRSLTRATHTHTHKNTMAESVTGRVSFVPGVRAALHLRQTADRAFRHEVPPGTARAYRTQCTQSKANLLLSWHTAPCIVAR